MTSQRYGDKYMETMEFMAKWAAPLSSLVIKGTASAVNAKIETIKTEKNIDKVRNKYDEIINELISDNQEAIRLALLYKSELEKIEISDQDIEHLHNTVTRVLDILKVMSPKTPVDTFEPLKELIDVDTLKAMQLLGFNYKAAIGEPLTELCASVILSKVKSQNNTDNNPPQKEENNNKKLLPKQNRR